MTLVAAPALPPRPAAPKPAVGEWRCVVSTALTILSAALLGFAIYLGFVSQLHHDRAQLTAYASFRKDLAWATAPVGPTKPDDSTKLLTPGTPVALLEIPELGLKEVVFEGTDALVLEDGPGHLRSTPLPGQPGTSILMGRSTMYGGPFGQIGTLAPGDAFTVTTGQGVSTYTVGGVRRAGDPQPPPLASGAGRLTMLTADGNPFVANGLLRVDADLTSAAVARPPAAVTVAELRPAERALGTDDGAWYSVVLVGEALVAAAGLSAWSRFAWGGRQTWVVAFPVLVLLSVAVADQAARLLPNLL